MSNERETGRRLAPKERLLISAKVNRLCESTPETFDPSTQVTDAQDIVHALDSQVMEDEGVSGKYSGTSSGSRIEGATEHGTVGFDLEPKETNTTEFGYQGYRIGNYVARKYSEKKTSSLLFEYFEALNPINIVMERDSERTNIVYQKASLEVIEIDRGIPRRRKFWRITLKDYKNIPLWKKAE